MRSRWIGLLGVALALMGCASRHRGSVVRPTAPPFDGRYELEPCGRWLVEAMRANLCVARSRERVADSEWLVPVEHVERYRVDLDLRSDGTFVVGSNGSLMPSARLTMEDGVIRSARECPVEYVVLLEDSEDEGTWRLEGSELVLRGARRESRHRVLASGRLAWESFEDLGDVVLARWEQAGETIYSGRAYDSAALPPGYRASSDEEVARWLGFAMTRAARRWGGSVDAALSEFVRHAHPYMLDSERPVRPDLEALRSAMRSRVQELEDVSETEFDAVVAGALRDRALDTLVAILFFGNKYGDRARTAACGLAVLGGPEARSALGLRLAERLPVGEFTSGNSESRYLLRDFERSLETALRVLDGDSRARVR